MSFLTTAQTELTIHSGTAVTLLAQEGGSGSQSINNAVQNVGSFLRTLALSVLGVMVIVVGLMMAFNCVKRDSNIREEIGRFGKLLLAAFVIGGGVAFVGWMIQLGGEVAA